LIGTSSTGILSTHDLLPLLLKPLYRGLLAKPHQDKINMENTISQEYYSDKWIIVRGALYRDGKGTGKYRVGETEVGYTIRREDVAHFIVNQCIEGDNKWLGKRPVVVY
jgi:NAD(P)H-binding